MSKKKNTLNDLEEFLKMQASALVTPAPLGEKQSEQPVIVAPAKTAIKTKPVDAPVALTESQLLEGVQNLSSANKKAFYDFLIRVAETLPNRSKEDVLLINTALYLKGGANWKETVKDYWKKS